MGPNVPLLRFTPSIESSIGMPIGGPLYSHFGFCVPFVFGVIAVLPVLVLLLLIVQVRYVPGPPSFADWRDELPLESERQGSNDMGTTVISDQVQNKISLVKVLHLMLQSPSRGCSVLHRLYLPVRGALFSSLIGAECIAQHVRCPSATCHTVSPEQYLGPQCFSSWFCLLGFYHPRCPWCVDAYPLLKFQIH